MNTITLGAAVLAVTEFIKRLLPEQVSGPVTIVVAGILGLAFAYIGGGNLLDGALTGLGASGVHLLSRTVAGK